MALILDLPFERTSAPIELMPRGQTLSVLQDMLVRRLEREITVTVQAQLLLMTTAGDNMAGNE